MQVTGKKNKIDNQDFLSIGPSLNFKDFIYLDKFRYNEQAFFLINNMDGRTSSDDLKLKFKKFFSIPLSDKIFLRLLRKLEKSKLLLVKKGGYLLSKISKSYLIELVKKYEQIFKKIKIKNSIFDGVMYKSEPRGLKRDIERCFASVKEKKLRNILRKIKILKGIVVPHSNIELSGTCAAWAYRAVELMGLPDVIILLVPNHTFRLRKYPFSVCVKSFRTPFGVVRTAESFINKLAEECEFDIFQNELAHLYEHAIEIQLPFLQFIYRSTQKKLLIVPIICNLSGITEFHKRPGRLWYHFLNALRSCIMRSRESVLIIASGDLYHQKGSRISECFHEKNKKIIKAMEKADKSIIAGLYVERSNICCIDPFVSFLELLRPKRGLLLDYSWSGKQNLVQKLSGKKKYVWSGQIGFASMVF